MEWQAHISLGEVVLAASTLLSALGAAWYVGFSLKKRQDRDFALRDLMRFFCREILTLVANASDVIDKEFARTTDGFDAVGRNNVRLALQRLSNSIHALDHVVRRAEKLDGHNERQKCLHDLKDANDALRQQVLDPLVTDNKLEQGNARQVEGALGQVRDAAITLEIEVIAKLE